MQIITGGDEAFSSLAFGLQNPVNVQYFNNQIQQAKQALGSTFGEFGNRFLNRAEELYDRFNNSRSMELARAALNQVRGIFQADVVRDLRTLSEFQIATPVMQRWVMTNPMVREMYHSQQCDGYSDTYVDTQPGMIGENHYDYRRVRNGIVDVTDEGWHVTTYAETLKEGDKELEFDEQVRILRTWENLENLLYQKLKDPTSVWNNDL